MRSLRPIIQNISYHDIAVSIIQGVSREELFTETQ